MTDARVGAGVMIGCVGLGVMIGAALCDGKIMPPAVIVVGGAVLAILGYVFADVFIIDRLRAERGERECRLPDIRI